MQLTEFRRILRQALLVPIFALLVLAGFLIWQITAATTAQRWLDHSEQIGGEVRGLEGLIIDQETGLRGYQLTGDSMMLAPYRAAAAPIDSHFTALRQLVSGDPDQAARLAVLRDRYQIWLGFAQTVLSAKDAAIHDPQLNQHGKMLMDAVRLAVRNLRIPEERLRRQRYRAAERMEGRTLEAVLLSALAVGILLAIFMLSRVRRVSSAYRSSLEEQQHRADLLYASREWLQTTLESIGDAVITCDAEGCVDFLNSIAERLTGWTLQEAHGRPLDKVFHIVNEETRDVCENPVEKVRRLNTVIGLANHTLLISKDGKEYVIDDSAAPILSDRQRDETGNMIGIVLVFRDVTMQRRTETALLASEKLAVAGRLAASIAHEIHNPLDSVANLHFLLKTEDDPAKRAEYLELAQQELSRTLQISRAMLSLYREPKAPIMIELQELIESVLLLLDRRLTDMDITVERDFEPQLSIEGFPAELRQVFTNLIANAMEAAGLHGRMRIRLYRTAEEEFHGAGCIVEITDSGPGISGDAAANLFQPFFTTKGENGTGLGLWVSMGIVQKHGGTIRIANSESTELRGACVRIFLPAHTLAMPSTRSTPHLS